MPHCGQFALILASDDEELAAGLREAGHDVLRTNDGFEAIRMTIESKPDALILDETTRGLPTPTVAIWLKLTPSTQNVPIIGLRDDKDGWREAQVDAEVPREGAVHRLTYIAQRLIDNADDQPKLAEPVEVTDFDPITATTDIINIYRERLSLASAMIELTNLQHDLADSEYTIKSILEVAGRAMGSSLIGITLIRERIHYILVRGKQVTKNHLVELERYAYGQLSEYVDKPLEIEDELIIGRRWIRETDESESKTVKCMGHPVYSRGEVLGYIAGIMPEDGSQPLSRASLLPDLTSQIALLLVNSELIAAQEGYVDELSSILRAAGETAKISPQSDVSSKSFLVQFLLIVLDLCHTSRGCVMLLNNEDNGEELGSMAALGCDEEVFLNAPLKGSESITKSISRLHPNKVVQDTVQLDSNDLSRLTVPLVAGDKIMGALMILDFIHTLSPRIIDSIKTLAGFAGFFVHNHNVHLREVETSIIEDQLNLAREIQFEMLPEGHPKYPGYDIYGRSVPAKEVGGDFFDYIYRDDKLTIAIGDVCGKSIPASLLMTMTRALVLATSETKQGPGEVLYTVNSLLSHMITEGRFVTGSLMQMDDSKICYASAGHQPLLIYRSGSDVFEEVDADGIALGIVSEMDFEQVEFQLDVGDIAVMYTDGLNEAMNPIHEQFGYENIHSIIKVNAEKSSMQILEALFKAIEVHADGASQSDDTTVVVIKKTKEEVMRNANS